MGLFFTGMAMERGNHPYYFNTFEDSKLLYARAGIGFIAAITWYYGVTMLPLGDAMSLIITNPLFTAILAPTLLGERTSVKKLAITALGFSGAVFISKPSFIRELLQLPLEEQTQA